MDTTNVVAPQSKPGSVEPTIVTFVVSDPEVLLALAEYPDGPARTNFLVTALKIGVLSLKAARGTLDSDTLRREGDRLMEELGTRLGTWRTTFEERVSGSLAHYFDPQQGTFMERVHRLTKTDGDLATVVRQQVQDAQSNLTKVFEQFIGENSQLFRMLDPTGGNQLVVTLQRTLDSGGSLSLKDLSAMNDVVLRSAAVELNIASIAVATFGKTDGTLAGMVCVLDDKPRCWSPDEVITLTEYGNLAGTELQLRQLLSDREVREQRLRHDLLNAHK